MTERPIIFSGPMVRAILDGRKSQTRRALKPQPDWVRDKVMLWKNRAGLLHTHSGLAKPGDRFYVRETWSSPYCYAEFRPRDCGGPFWYWADGNPTDGDWSRPRPSIHMPKWAARIWLTVTEVRVQRLQDISEEDALAEGVAPDHDFPSCFDGPHIHGFAQIWISIHGAGAWAANPWVAAITFERAS